MIALPLLLPPPPSTHNHHSPTDQLELLVEVTAAGVIVWGFKWTSHAPLPSRDGYHCRELWGPASAHGSGSPVSDLGSQFMSA